MFERGSQGQGALEYLLILGAAIVIVAVVVFVIMSAATSAPTDDANASIASSYDRLRDLIPGNNDPPAATSCTLSSECSVGESCGDLFCSDFPTFDEDTGDGLPLTIELASQIISVDVDSDGSDETIDLGGTYTKAFLSLDEGFRRYYASSDFELSFQFSDEGEGEPFVGSWHVVSKSSIADGYYVVLAAGASSVGNGPFVAGWSQAIIYANDGGGSGYLNRGATNFTSFSDGNWTS
jgi:hypothetical protein